MADSGKPPSIVLEVEGMMCQKNCASTVESAIRSIPTVQDCRVSHPNRTAEIWIKDGELVNPTEIIDAIECVGYDARVKENSNASMHGITFSDTSSNHNNTNNKDATYDFLPGANDNIVADNNAPDVTLLVEGMKRLSDLKVVEAAILAVEGVVSVEFDLSEKLAYIYGFADTSTLIAAIKHVGFTAIDGDEIDFSARRAATTAAANNNNNNNNQQTTKDNQQKNKNQSKHNNNSTTTINDHRKIIDLSDTGIDESRYNKKEYIYKIRGMSCGACASKVERTWQSMPGVVDVAVSVMTHKGRVVIDSSVVNAVGPRDILEKATELGYPTTLDNAAENAAENKANNGESEEFHTWRILFIIAMILGIPVTTIHLVGEVYPPLMMLMMQPAVCYGGINLGQLTMFLLNLSMLLTVGAKYYKSAIQSAYHGSYGMDFLVMVGTSISFAYSTFELYLACEAHIPSEHVFFEASGMLLLFVTAGKFFEAYAKDRSASAIASLLTLQPQEAYLVNAPSAGRILQAHERATLEKVAEDMSSKKHTKGVSKDLEGEHIPMDSSTHSHSSTGSTAGQGLWIDDQDVQRMAVDLIQRGDVVKVLPGDRIPTDGKLLWGVSAIDECMITGESMPVNKSLGDDVFGSTINQDSTIFIQVTSCGADSTLAQIVRLVEAAQMNKAPIQKYADYIAGIFTPCILVLATLTFLVWLILAYTHTIPEEWFEAEYGDPFLFALLFAISVVVISCPCALGLATPTAVMVGTTVGATNGILIKGGAAFEIAHKVDTVIFDKTGTLTEGKPSVTDLIIVKATDNANTTTTSTTTTTTVEEEEARIRRQERDHLLTIAATAEQNSDHPLALAIIRAAKARQLALWPLPENSSTSHVGSGMSCDVYLSQLRGEATASSLNYKSKKCRISVGNRNFMRQQGVNVTAVADSAMWNLEIQGKTAICVAVDDEVFGVLGISDVPKPEAEVIIRALRAQGIDVWMLTGDNARTAEALANKLEISSDRVLAGVLPQDKAAKVKELQQQGRIVAMVGDGVNDSPALVQANLGIAIGAGTQIAIEAANMVLIRSNLYDLVVAFDLAKVVFARIRWNFMWAVVYNFVAIPFAAGVWFPWTKMLLPPHYAGLSMAMSSISVVISSMMLKFYRRPDFTNFDTIQSKPTSSSWFWWEKQASDQIRISHGYDVLPVDERDYVDDNPELGIELGLGSINNRTRKLSLTLSQSNPLHNDSVI